MNITKRLFVVLAALAVLALGPGVTAADANSSPSRSYCRGESCNGQGPIRSGCSRDARTVRWASGKDPAVGNYFIELRYSPRCRTAWARTTVDRRGSRYARAATRVDRIGSNLPKQASRIDRPTSDGRWYEWTSMINDAGYQARACLFLEGTRTIECTGSY